jgi:hypothetical protein
MHRLRSSRRRNLGGIENGKLKIDNGKLEVGRRIRN